jgi:hypothetical protein
MKSITFHKFLVKPDTDTQKFLFVYQWSLLIFSVVRL